MQGRNCTHIVIQSSVLGDIFIHVAASNITTYFQWPLNVLTENDFSLKCHLWKLELTVNWVLIFSYSKNIQNPGKSKRGARKMCFLAPGFWPKFPQALYTAYLKKKKNRANCSLLILKMSPFYFTSSPSLKAFSVLVVLNYSSFKCLFFL